MILQVWQTFGLRRHAFRHASHSISISEQHSSVNGRAIVWLWVLTKAKHAIRKASARSLRVSLPKWVSVMIILLLETVSFAGGTVQQSTWGAGAPGLSGLFAS
jgi:hypothetical protein